MLVDPFIKFRKVNDIFSYSIKYIKKKIINTIFTLNSSVPYNLYRHFVDIL